jgi:hypothetical protein
MSANFKEILSATLRFAPFVIAAISVIIFATKNQMGMFQSKQSSNVKITDASSLQKRKFTTTITKGPPLEKRPWKILEKSEKKM